MKKLNTENILPIYTFPVILEDYNSFLEHLSFTYIITVLSRSTFRKTSLNLSV